MSITNEHTNTFKLANFGFKDPVNATYIITFWDRTPCIISSFLRFWKSLWREFRCFFKIYQRSIWGSVESLKGSYLHKVLFSIFFKNFYGSFLWDLNFVLSMVDFYYLLLFGTTSLSYCIQMKVFHWYNPKLMYKFCIFGPYNYQKIDISIHHFWSENKKLIISKMFTIFTFLQGHQNVLYKGGPNISDDPQGIYFRYNSKEPSESLILEFCTLWYRGGIGINR